MEETKKMGGQNCREGTRCMCSPSELPAQQDRGIREKMMETIFHAQGVGVGNIEDNNVFGVMQPHYGKWRSKN